MFRTVALILLGTSFGFGFSVLANGNGFVIKVPQINAGKLECRWLPENPTSDSIHKNFSAPEEENSFIEPY